MIRRRLVLAITVTVAAAIGIGSWLIVMALEDRLVDNIDEQFVSGSLSADIRRQLAARPQLGARTRGVIDERRELAIVVYGAGGGIVRSYAAGTAGDPEPLPDADDLLPAEGLATVGSIGDGPRYRAIALDAQRGARVVVGVSMADVDATLREARRIQTVVGLVAIAAVGLVCWLLIRRAFAPIDGMIATAGRIAEGDLTERTDVEDDTSEVGRLGLALDTMLDRIELAVADKTASEERMRRFVADASHDLRTPLTSVRGYAELYRQGGDDPETVARSMERIEAEATRMSRLVDDLMLLARLDQQRTPDARPVDLGRLAGETVDAVRMVDHERIYDLDAAADAQVAGDPDQLRQLLDNLLTNARVHTPPGTTVDVTVGRSGTEVILVVADDGPGIAEAERGRVFDRFWRSKRADESRTQGSGLGLSIVSAIVDAHGGRVVADRSEAGGARFTVTLAALAQLR
jgi:two-component system OmpR family sensor kinase